MEYIFIHARKDVMIEKNYEMKNSNENRKIIIKKCRSVEIRMNLFIDNKQSNQQKNTVKNKC